MIFPAEFIDLNLTFARKVAQVTQQSMEDAILGYTHIYLSFGLDRSFDPAHPVWHKYLEGLQKNTGACAWTYSFYLQRQAQIPPKPLPDPSFGCFSYALWPGNRVRIHFRDAETSDYSPLSHERADLRLSELRTMFQYIQERVENPETVIGGSWLYNIDAYRRLFPPAFLETARVSLDDYQFIALWGQFIDHRGQIRQELATHFLQELATSHSIQSVQACFPFQVLRLESPIEVFYGFFLNPPISRAALINIS